MLGQVHLSGSREQLHSQDANISSLGGCWDIFRDWHYFKQQQSGGFSCCHPRCPWSCALAHLVLPSSRRRYLLCVTFGWLILCPSGRSSQNTCMWSGCGERETPKFLIFQNYSRSCRGGKSRHIGTTKLKIIYIYLFNTAQEWSWGKILGNLPWIHLTTIFSHGCSMLL